MVVGGTAAGVHAQAKAGSGLQAGLLRQQPAPLRKISRETLPRGLLRLPMAPVNAPSLAALSSGCIENISSLNYQVGRRQALDLRT
ncbi:hypothetical protein CHELA1G11_13684 [Hyphomicrobiales bacterium]|nr:hypothetical protein CHELA1G2_10631 [Hyphomicrobiales bacterium]CAH1673316.1 hypothetical protein CHELA1G11_13684 [Hyphomicrobiales bacterium]